MLLTKQALNFNIYYSKLLLSEARLSISSYEHQIQSLPPSSPQASLMEIII